MGFAMCGMRRRRKDASFKASTDLCGVRRGGLGVRKEGGRRRRRRRRRTPRGGITPSTTPQEARPALPASNSLPLLPRVQPNAQHTQLPQRQGPKGQAAERRRSSSEAWKKGEEGAGGGGGPNNMPPRLVHALQLFGRLLLLYLVVVCVL